MTRIFLDADVVIDFLLNREPFAKEIRKIMTLADKREVIACISSLTVSHAYYFLRKVKGSGSARKGIADLIEMLEILPVDGNGIKQAIKSGFNDLEDGIQYQSALADGSIEAIITRNSKDFKRCEIPVMNPSTFVKMLSSISKTS